MITCVLFLLNFLFPAGPLPLRFHTLRLFLPSVLTKIQLFGKSDRRFYDSSLVELVKEVNDVESIRIGLSLFGRTRILCAASTNLARKGISE